MPGPISDTMPSLPERMRAAIPRHPEHADRLEELAADLEAKADFSQGMKAMLGAWARARRFWDGLGYA